MCQSPDPQTHMDTLESPTTGSLATFSLSPNGHWSIDIKDTQEHGDVLMERPSTTHIILQRDNECHGQKVDLLSKRLTMTQTESVMKPRV